MDTRRFLWPDWGERDPGTTLLWIFCHRCQKDDVWAFGDHSQERGPWKCLSCGRPIYSTDIIRELYVSESVA